MGRSGCFSCLKFLVFITNFLFWLVGLGVVAVSLWLLFDEQLYKQTLDAQREDYFTGTYLILVVGALMTIIGFLGCCGAWRESTIMLGLFFAFLVMITLIEICAGVYIYFQQDKLHTLLDKSVEETVLKKYHYNTSAASVHTFDKIQEELQCCGAHGPKDWSRSVFNNPTSLDRELGVINNNNYRIPRSCCRVPETKSCLVATELQVMEEPDPVILYTQGCADVIKTMAEENIIYIVALGLGVFLLELMGLFLSMCLCCAIKRIEDMKA